jgi:predicted nucleic acid-binding Zn ribbon protein
MTQRRRRRRSDDQTTIQERLSAWAEQLRAQAAQLPPGPERNCLLMKAREADMTAHIDRWINSRGL